MMYDVRCTMYNVLCMMYLDLIEDLLQDRLVLVLHDRRLKYLLRDAVGFDGLDLRPDMISRGCGYGYHGYHYGLWWWAMMGTVIVMMGAISRTVNRTMRVPTIR